MVTQLPLLDLRATPSTRPIRRSVRGVAVSVVGPAAAASVTAPASHPARDRKAVARPIPEPPTLVERGPVDWRLDEHTREIGRRGVAEARRALAAAVERVAAAA